MKIQVYFSCLGDFVEHLVLSIMHCSIRMEYGITISILVPSLIHYSVICDVDVFLWHLREVQKNMQLASVSAQEGLCNMEMQRVAYLKQGLKSVIGRCLSA